jgi:hypothetical protein
MPIATDVAAGLQLKWLSNWQQRGNHAGHTLCTAQLIDSDGIIQPGLTVELEMKAPIFSDRCLFLFSLFRLEHGMRRRLYQLDVQPKNKRTHNGVTTLYGPHEHVGNEEPSLVNNPTVSCDNWDAGWSYFCSRTGIVHTTAPAL